MPSDSEDDHSKFKDLFRTDPLADTPPADRSPPPPTKELDTPRSKEAEKHVLDAARLKNVGERDRLDRLKLDHTHIWDFRRRFGRFAVWNVVFWQACILAIIAFHGVGLLNIDTSVLIALLTTTTVNVFAFLVIVMKFVFASPDSKWSKTYATAEQFRMA